jgi:DNA-binding LytR/AlgR family response regulator
MRRSDNPYHPDITLFLLLIPFISAFNYYLTYSNIRLSWFLALTFTIDTVQGYAAWWTVRQVILLLDKKWPYGPKPVSRILLQLVITTVAGLAVISILTEIVSWIAKGQPAPLSFYTVDLVIISIWFFVINGIYIGLHFYNTWRRSEEERAEENKLKIAGLTVRQGKSELRIPFDELLGLYVDSEYVMAYQQGGKKFVVDQSLDKLEDTLPSSVFFRLNRQFLVHQQLVEGFRREANGKLIVALRPHDQLPTEVPVSRTKAPSFKAWFRPS